MLSEPFAPAGAGFFSEAAVAFCAGARGATRTSPCQSSKFLRAKNLTKSAALMHVLKNQAHMARK